ncbi:MAG: hypothetical protein H6715_05705 [Myxococcales bacterium]|nr:hypothetical protein [Myxococcales bacterium]MCB9707904.1 hypothetical protein [Myxococcales bacterium]
MDRKTSQLFVMIIFLLSGCGEVGQGLAANQTGIEGGAPGGSGAVRLVRRAADGSQVIVGTGVKVGPAHVATATQPFIQEGVAAFDAAGRWVSQGQWAQENGPRISYVVRAPRLAGTSVQWDGPIALAILENEAPAVGSISLATYAYESLTGTLSSCAYTIEGFDPQGQHVQTPYCVVSASFLSTDLYVSTVERYYASLGHFMSGELGQALRARFTPNEETMLLVTNPSAFQRDAQGDNGAVCPADVGAPIVDDTGSLVGIYVGNVDVDVVTSALGLPGLPACGDEAHYQVARGAPIFDSNSFMTPSDFIRRAVANCRGDMDSEECKARVLCNPKDYRLDADNITCLPSCGELARLNRSSINARLSETGHDPSAVSDSCALWCDNGQPDMPYWSVDTRLALGQSFDCEQCWYYPPGQVPYPAQCN